MKFLLHLLILMLMAAAFQINFPWWSIAIAGVLTGTFGRLKPGMAALAGLAGGFLLWSGYAAYLDFQNQHLLSNKLAQLIFKNQQGLLLVLLSGGVGGLVAGLGMLCGALGRSVWGKSTTP